MDFIDTLSEELTNLAENGPGTALDEGALRESFDASVREIVREEIARAALPSSPDVLDLADAVCEPVRKEIAQAGKEAASPSASLPSKPAPEPEGDDGLEWLIQTWTEFGPARTADMARAVRRWMREREGGES